MAGRRVCSECFEEFDAVPGGPETLCGACSALRRRVELEEGLLATAWRDGRLLVVDRLDPELPDRCVKCGRPADVEPLRRELAWHPPWVFLLLLLGGVGYIVGALASRRSVTVYVPLCRSHRNGRRGVVAGALAALAASLVSLFVGAAHRSDALVWVFLLALLLSAALGVVAARMILVPSRIEADLAWLKGAGPRFLEHLGDLPSGHRGNPASA